MSDGQNFSQSDLLLVDEAGDSLLKVKCPTCGSLFTHHTNVEVFNREEDSKNGRKTFANNEATFVNEDLSKNPSARRDGVTIDLYCEQCPARLKFDIFQHKGQTVLKMRSKDE